MLTTTSTTSETVVLRGGLSVPLAALRLLWSLEDRGLVIRLDPTGELRIGPREYLTDADRANIRRWRDALAAAVAYCDTRVM